MGERGPQPCPLCHFPHFRYLEEIPRELRGDDFAQWIRALKEGRLCAAERCPCPRCPTTADLMADVDARIAARERERERQDAATVRMRGAE